MTAFTLCRIWLRRLALCLLAPLIIFSAAQADPFKEGYQYFNDGDYDRAIAIWTAAANAGQYAPMTALQSVYENGSEGWDDVPDFLPDAAKASYWRQKAEIQFVREKELEKLYFGAIEFDRAGDHVSAARDFAIAAEGGNDHAMGELSAKYYNGQGVTKSYDQAFYWAQRAANLGNIYATTLLGFYYGEGNGAEQSFSDALRYFRKSEADNDPLAFYYLGFMHADGKGVPQSSPKAMAYFKAAADGGLEGAGKTYRDYQAHEADYQRRVAKVNAYNREVDRYNAEAKRSNDRIRQQRSTPTYTLQQGLQDMSRAIACTRQQQRCVSDSQYQRCSTYTVNVC